MHGPVPPIPIYIHVLLHRLGMIAGNHFNQPYRGAVGVGFSVSDLLATREVVILRFCSSPFIILEIESYIMMQIESGALLNFHAKGLP